MEKIPGESNEKTKRMKHYEVTGEKDDLCAILRKDRKRKNLLLYSTRSGVAKGSKGGGRGRSFSIRLGQRNQRIEKEEKYLCRSVLIPEEGGRLDVKAWREKERGRELGWT